MSRCISLLTALVELLVATSRATNSVAFIFSSTSSSTKREEPPFIIYAAPADAADDNVWSPRSRHWAEDNFFKQEKGLQIGIDLDESCSSFNNNTAVDAVDANLAAAVTTIHRDRNGKAIAVEVASALSEHQISTVCHLAKCIQNSSIGSSQFENRSFGEGKGGNDCTYLTPMLQRFRHDIAARVVEIIRLAWKSACWDDIGYPDPFALGIRTSEHLVYESWRGLKGHKDKDSIYTVMISIASPQDYEGGEFFVHNSLWKSTNIKPDQFSAIVFLSETTHGVQPISSGHRETFVTELWTSDDSPLGMNRPTPEQWDEYIAMNRVGCIEKSLDTN